MAHSACGAAATFLLLCVLFAGSRYARVGSLREPMNMGYDLTNSSGQTRQWKVLGWWHLLNLALECGWSPRGTESPTQSQQGWDGNYFRNEGNW